MQNTRTPDGRPASGFRAGEAGADDMDDSEEIWCRSWHRVARFQEEWNRFDAHGPDTTTPR